MEIDNTQKECLIYNTLWTKKLLIMTMLVVFGTTLTILIYNDVNMMVSKCLH